MKKYKHPSTYLCDTLGTTAEDSDLIERIVERSVDFYTSLGYSYDRFVTGTDIQRVHKKTPLRLAEWLAADDGNFIHDIAGIHNNYDRWDGVLKNCFVPRFAVTQ